MELELTVLAVDGSVIWSSGFVEGRAIWLRGATVLDTREAQRRGRRMILDELVDDVTQRFLSFESMKEMP